MQWEEVLRSVCILPGVEVDNSWANNSHAEMKFLYNPKEITYTDLAIWNNIFQWGYRIINTANMVISRADNDGINWGSGADAENRKNEVLAEARFFRAWAYRHLTYSFGSVPPFNTRNYRIELS